MPDEALQALALYNYGHYTSMLVKSGGVRGLALHLDRLTSDSAELFGKSVDPRQVLDEIRAYCSGRGGDLVVRVTVYAADFTMQHPADATDLRILVTDRPAPTRRPEPVSLATVPFVREVPQVKHVGIFGQLWSRRTAQLGGYDDALLIDPNGTIVEGATWNVGFIRADGHVVWPESDALPGVTLALTRAEHERQQPEQSTECPITTDMLGDFAAAFTTNAVSAVRPISGIDGHSYDTGHPMLNTLARQYDAIKPDLLD